MTDLRLGVLGYGLRGSLVRIVDEFLRFVRQGGRTDASPVAARMAVAAGFGATRSLRAGGAVQDEPALDAEVPAYFGRGQV